MKKVITVLFILGTIVSNSQSLTEKKDSVKIKRNEIGPSLLPILTFFAGSTPGSEVRYNLNYRRYFDKKNAGRLTFSFFPHQPIFYNYINNTSFYQYTDTFSVYKSKNYKQDPKVQLSIGFEHIFKSRFLIHSFGADLFVNYQHYEQSEKYYWISFRNDTSEIPEINRSNNVDSIGFVKTTDYNGIGLRPFYNLRIPLGKFFLISATMGFDLAFGINRTTETDFRRKTYEKRRSNNFDFNGALISDLSLCFKF